MGFFEEEHVTPDFFSECRGSSQIWVHCRGPLGLEHVREEHWGYVKADAAREVGGSQARCRLILQQAFTVPGFGDSSKQADVILALVGFVPQRLGEHGQQLGPCLGALITTERFEQRSDRTSLSQ